VTISDWFLPDIHYKVTQVAWNMSSVGFLLLFMQYLEIDIMARTRAAVVTGNDYNKKLSSLKNM